MLRAVEFRTGWSAQDPALHRLSLSGGGDRTLPPTQGGNTSKAGAQFANDGDDLAENAAAGTTLVSQHAARPAPDGMRAIVRLVVLKSSALEKPVFQVRFSRRAGSAPGNERAGRAARPANLPSQFSNLTLREREVVVDCICRGMSNEAIAQHLSASVPTVKNQLHSIFQKLAVPSRAALMALIQAESGGRPRAAERAR